MIILSRIKPSKIICYGKPFDEMKGDNRGYRIFPDNSWERKIYDDMGGNING
jgi:hypothetical protein